MLDGTVSAAARSLGHFISFGITLGMMLILCGYVAFTIKRRYGSHCNKYGPLYCVAVATPLIMADLTRHVLQDTKVWPESGWPAGRGSAQYRAGCHIENMSCLSPVGIIFTICFTYSGFVLLAVGTLWNANIMTKLKDFKAQWRKIRSGN